MGTPLRLDSWKLVCGVALVAAAVFAYNQLLLDQPFMLRFVVLVAGIAAGIAFVCWGREGKILLAYLSESITELRKVVWPPRQQALQMSMLVVAMVLVVAVILGLLDWLLGSLTGWFLG